MRGRELRGFGNLKKEKGRLIKCNFHGRERGKTRRCGGGGEAVAARVLLILFLSRFNLFESF